MRVTSKLKAERMRRGITCTRLAEMIGLPQSNITEIENMHKRATERVQGIWKEVMHLDPSEKWFNDNGVAVAHPAIGKRIKEGLKHSCGGKRNAPCER